MKAVLSIKTWRLLHALNKTGALMSAAQQESIELSEASRRIAALESELGLILLDRRKKPAQLTEAAKRLDGQASRISRAHKSAMELAEKIKQEEAKHTTQRTVRISLPVNFDKVGLLSALYEYESRHENIRFEFSADSGIPALLEGSTDISMGGYLWDGKGVFALPVGRCFNFLMASESYIKRYGLPESIQDLLNGKHRLLMRNPKNRFFSNKLTNGRQTVYVGPHANVFYGDAEACREMLVTGGGIATDLSVGYVSEFIARALSPAKAMMVQINEDEKKATAIVPDDKLSLAIGKAGQNVRLAAKLTDWKIDVKPYSEVSGIVGDVFEG